MLGATQAAYTIKVPLEARKGGTLPNDSIVLKPEEWFTIAPEYTEWISQGVPYDCTNWSPAPSTKTIGQSFTQTATDCKQNQTRSRQDREQETTTKTIRNKGTAVTETQTITVSSTRAAVGTKNDFIFSTTSPKTYAECSLTYVDGNGKPYYKSYAIYNDAVILNITNITCSTSAGRKITGSDGKSYTLGPLISGTVSNGKYSIKRN